MISDQLLKLPGFIYEIEGKYYFLGKWICKECADTQATDSVVMYQMCRAGKEEPDTNMYFQKIRAFSDFALEVPFNPAKLKEDMAAVTGGLSEASLNSLKAQVQSFEEDLLKYCNEQIS